MPQRWAAGLSLALLGSLPSPPCSAQEAAPESGFIFAGLATRTEAPRLCGRGWHLATPKSAREQQVLAGAIADAIAAGNMTSNWPSDMVWLGADWSIRKGRWEWDDGTPLVYANWAPGQPNAASDQATQPYVCMASTGFLHDKDFGILMPNRYGVFCQRGGAAAEEEEEEEGGGEPEEAEAAEEAEELEQEETQKVALPPTGRAVVLTLSGPPAAGDADVLLPGAPATLSAGGRAFPVQVADARVGVPADSMLPVVAPFAPIAALPEAPAIPGAPAESESDCTAGISQGPIAIRGMENTYIGGVNGSTNGDELILLHNAGVSVLNGCMEDWQPDGLAQFQLLGKTISFTVDLSQAGCACNVAVYLISSPARDIFGQPDPGTDRGGQPPYYCDANKVGGQWCPEVDLMEANSHAFQATAHRCATPRNRHYRSCDRLGCAQNTKTMHKAYGPGASFTIDTRYPFEVITSFGAAFGRLSSIRTTLRQAGREVLLSHKNCKQAYLASLSEALKEGMSLRITYWGGAPSTMAWMDAPLCGPHKSCSGEHAGPAAIRGIAVQAGATVAARSASELVHFMKKADAEVPSIRPRLHTPLMSTLGMAACVCALAACGVLMVGVRLPQALRRSRADYVVPGEQATFAFEGCEGEARTVTERWI